MSNDPACVTNWIVSEEVSHSDHRVIKFSINDIKKTEVTLRQNVRKVNWAKVSTNLRRAVPRDTPATWTRASLDKACKSLTSLSINTHLKSPQTQSLITGGTRTARRKRHC
jgi:hypothetical protein